MDVLGSAQREAVIEQEVSGRRSLTFSLAAEVLNVAKL